MTRYDHRDIKINRAVALDQGSSAGQCLEMFLVSQQEGCCWCPVERARDGC